MIVLGTLVFNEIVTIPLFGFNKYTKEALQNTKNEENEDRSLAVTSLSGTDSKEDNYDINEKK